MNYFLCLVIPVAFGSLVVTTSAEPDWIYHKDDDNNCTYLSGLCTPVSECKFVPPQFIANSTIRNHFSICTTRDKICCTSLLKPPICSRRAEREPVSSGGVVLRPRISLGLPSRLGDWPWMAAVGYKDEPEEKNKWFCGGSLINHLFVLTAAHCKTKLTVIVRLGGLDTSSTTGEGYVDVDVKEFIHHYQYSIYNHKQNDIALLKLSTSVIFNDNIQPICLPESKQLRARTFEKMEAYVAGWGLTETDEKSSILLETRVTVRNATECQEYETFRLSSTQICTIAIDQEDSCDGDSGGPLMVAVKGVYYVIGIVSRGRPCGPDATQTHGIYTRVTEYIDWIRETVRNNIQ